MSSSVNKSASELIGELCDGNLSRQDAAKLEALLLADPILQQEYLDQLLADGLLQYEYGMDQPTIPESASVGGMSVGSVLPKTRKQSLIIAWLLVLVATGVGWAIWPSARPSAGLSIPIANCGFENVLPIANHPTMGGWYGDVARIVRGSREAAAHEGEHMLQLIRSVHQPSEECEVYQAFSLRPFRGAIDYPAFIEVTVAVNTRGNKSGNSTMMALELFTSIANPLDGKMLAPETWRQDLMTAGTHVAADLDPDSWQELKLVMPLSEHARYAVVKIGAREPGNAVDRPFPEVFVDDVRVFVRGKDLL